MWRLGDGGPRALAVGLATLFLGVVVVSGCDDGARGDSTASTTSAPATVPAPPATSPGVATVTVWFADGEGALQPSRRAVPEGVDPLRAAIDELAAGPDDPALLPALPPGTTVVATSSDGAVATVDLGAAFESAYPPGGAAAELAVVGPLVRTAADASGAPLVRILVEGRAPAPIGSQLDFSEPFSPGDLPAP
jgi:spore germination protein GerM